MWTHKISGSLVLVIQLALACTNVETGGNDAGASVTGGASSTGDHASATGGSTVGDNSSSSTGGALGSATGGAATGGEAAAAGGSGANTGGQAGSGGSAGSVTGGAGSASTGGSSTAGSGGTSNNAGSATGGSATTAGASSNAGSSPTGGAASGAGGNAASGGLSGTGGSATGGSGSGDVPATRFFLPTGEPDNTSAPSLEVDSQGGLHAVYPAYAGGNAYYAYCGTDCKGTDDVKVVTFETQGTVANSMLALTRDGHPRVLLSAFQKVYYASCDTDCTNRASWTLSMILDHQSDREISGEALALDSKGRPRFLMHTYRAYLGIGQKPPKTWYATCDASCDNPTSWTYSEIAQEIWEGTTLRFDANDQPRIATVVNFNEGDQAGQKLSAYLECMGDCTTSDGWNGIGFIKPFESLTEAVSIHPTVSMALTRAGGPRVAVLGQDENGSKRIVYFECDSDCSNDHWQGAVVSNHDKIDAGLDLALDAQDHPRLTYTLDYNIGMAFCDATVCGGPNSSWDLTKVELSRDIPPDAIFLWDNCTVGAWFLHNPSLALTTDGKPRVGYQARDISGGWSQPDPTKPPCVAGTDMTWSRVALLASYK